MNDEGLAKTWSLLEPTSMQRQRIEDRVLDWLEADDTSLATEWLSLVRFRPIAALGYAAAGGLSLVLVTPFGWLAISMLSL